jgi:hypothetical protein
MRFEFDNFYNSHEESTVICSTVTHTAADISEAAMHEKSTCLTSGVVYNRVDDI